MPELSWRRHQVQRAGGLQVVRKLRSKQLTIPSPERSIVTLYHRHSIEEIMALTGLHRDRIQLIILDAIKRGEVKAYAPTET